MTQALLLFDSSERLVISNNRYLEMFGLSSDIVKPGRRFRDLVQHRKITGSFSGDVDEYCGAIREARNAGQVSHYTTVIPDGRWMQVINQPLADGGWVSTIEDITEQRRSEERTLRLALYDTLTELPNRACFLEHLHRLRVGIADPDHVPLLIGGRRARHMHRIAHAHRPRVAYDRLPERSC